MEDLTTTLFNVLLTLVVIAGISTVMALVMKFFDDSLSDQ
jgi:Flp pilus assembly pilin Flp